MRICRGRNKITVYFDNKVVQYTVYPYENSFSVRVEVGKDVFSLLPTVDADWDGFGSYREALKAIFEDIRFRQWEESLL